MGLAKGQGWGGWDFFPRLRVVQGVRGQGGSVLSGGVGVTAERCHWCDSTESASLLL